MLGSRTIRLAVIAALLPAALFAGLHPARAETAAHRAAPARPNIVLIAVNVLRATNLSCYGYPRQTTPAIDGLAGDSFVFDNAYAQAGYTMPNMMSIFTSLYPDSHQVYDAFKDELSARVKTLAEILRANGYTTGWFAHHSVAHLSPRAGFARGFDEYPDLGLRLEGKEYLFSWLRKNSGGPFFLAMNVRHTHSPYLPLEKYRPAFGAGLKMPVETFDQFLRGVYSKFLEKLRDPASPLYNSIPAETIAANGTAFNGEYRHWKLDRIESLLGMSTLADMGNLRVQTYFDLIDPKNEENRQAMIAYYDACILGTDQEIVKPLVELLKKRGIYDNTLIIVTGDHGESLGEHGLLGHGLDYYDQFIHVPLVMKLPASNRSRRDIPALAQSIDILPTALAVASIPVPPTAQGKSLLPLTAGPDTQLHEYVYGENHKQAYIRSRDWKLVIPRNPALGESTVEMLFDLGNDPGELRNVKGKHPEIYKKLREKLDEHLASLPRYVDRKYEFYPRVDRRTQEKIKKTGYW